MIRALIKISRDFSADPNAWAAAMVPYAPNTDEAGLQALAATFADKLERQWRHERDRPPVHAGLALLDRGFRRRRRRSRIDQWVDFGPVDAVLADVGTVDGDAAGR